jgi:hypothetical protein
MKLKWLPFNEGKVQGMCCELQRFYEKAEGLFFDAVGGADARMEENRLTLFTQWYMRMWRVHSCFHELSKGYSSSKLLFRKKKLK